MPAEYREKLPVGCPPDTAQEITAEVQVYRLVKNNPAADDDFRSQSAMFPGRHFNAGECLARGVSVCGTIQRAQNTQRLPRFRNTRICKVCLCAGAGRLLPGKDEHRTWWPYKTFDILAHCEMVTT